MQRCVGFKELKTVVPFGRAHVYRMMRDPKYHRGDPFPSPVRIGQCRVCWWLHEVTDWLLRRPRS